MEREGEFPSYRLVGDSEIDGDDQRFRVTVVLRGEPLVEGIGRTKRAAERRAARAALARQGARAPDGSGAEPDPAEGHRDDDASAGGDRDVGRHEDART